MNRLLGLSTYDVSGENLFAVVEVALLLDGRDLVGGPREPVRQLIAGVVLSHKDEVALQLLTALAILACE